MKSEKYRHHSLRMQGYDYSTPGAYFITVLAYHRTKLFGEVVNKEVLLNSFGRIVKQTWEWLSEQYPYVELGEFVVMPDHIHGVLQIIDFMDTRRGGSRPAPIETSGEPLKIKPLGQLIGAFKTVSSKKINLFRSTPGAHVWQRNYYEHIIRNQAEMSKIWDYIAANPYHDSLDTRSYQDTSES